MRFYLRKNNGLNSIVVVVLTSSDAHHPLKFVWMVSRDGGILGGA